MANAEWERWEEQYRFDDERQLEREEERHEAEDLPERAARQLVEAFRGAFFTEGLDLSTVTPQLLRTIGNSYQSSVERRLSAQLDMSPPLRRLRDAMEVYVAVNPDAGEALFGPQECPF
jgi:hypothetical protein